MRLLDERYLKSSSRYEHHRRRLEAFGFKRFEDFDRSKKVVDAPKSKTAKPDEVIAWWHGWSILWEQVEEHGAKADAAIRRAAETTPDAPTRINGIAALDEITFDDERVTVVGIDEEGLLMRSEHDGEDLEVSWKEIEVVEPGVWRQIRPARKTSKTAKATKPSKPEPHRARKEPWADHHARHGQQVAAFEVAGKWSVIARAADEKAPAWDVRVQNLRGDPTVTRVRVYNRGQKCTWDSLDGGGP